jgi:aryl-alcohol dehydrogenase-like predicted oxidoreductase
MSGGQAKRGAGKGQKDDSSPPLKRSNVKIVFGTMTLAGSVDAATSRQMLDAFFSHSGVKEAGAELDTAFLYEDGRTEELLGKIMTEEERKSIFIATKGSPAIRARYFPFICVFITF